MGESNHLGTKGCVFDFTEYLSEARYKALQSYVCSVCRQRFQKVGAGFVADEIVRVLDTKWLGRLGNPNSPAAIVKKLGYNLFLTKGFQPTWRERVLAGLRDAGVKEVLRLAANLLLAGLLLWLGLKDRPRPAERPVVPRHDSVSDAAVKRDAATTASKTSGTSNTAGVKTDTTQTRKVKKAARFK